MQQNSHEAYMQEALKLAKEAFDRDEVPVGAVVVCGGRIIARAYNLTQTLNDPTAHAEMQAITASCDYLGGKYLDECTLYVTLEPCPMCAGALAWAQLGSLVYGASDLKRGYSLFDTALLHPKTKVIKGIAAAESEALLKQFFSHKR